MDKELIIIVGAFCIILYLLSRFATYNYIMKNLAIIIEDIAIAYIYANFKKSKKKFYNNNGSISVPAQKAIQNKVKELNTTCQFYSKDFYYYYRNHRPILKCRVRRMIRNYINEHANIKLNHNYAKLTPDQFFKLRKQTQGDMVGVYVIYNHNRNMYYVGQATRLFFRVNQHMTGHGNGDVYADYKRGKDKITIQLFPLANSGYYDLDKFEKDMIAKYDAYNNGYNKTSGNGT
ncbi:MAG: GIY-YIG nuclease family protein [Bacilli bacterium]|nr:GIY-YIG nuclease family protein [Bacilli bacterium]MBQ8218609.1 GIY-YIG nuclease family protein [Bacilli bacterium]